MVTFVMYLWVDRGDWACNLCDAGFAFLCVVIVK